MTPLGGEFVLTCLLVAFKEFGLSLLRKGATEMNLRSMLCALLLLCYYTFLTFILGKFHQPSLCSFVINDCKGCHFSSQTG